MIADDTPPLKRPSHEIGQDLALLSAGELEARIAILRAEIERIETEIAAKRSSRAAADAFFKG